MRRQATGRTKTAVTLPTWRSPRSAVWPREPRRGTCVRWPRKVTRRCRQNSCCQDWQAAAAHCRLTPQPPRLFPCPPAPTEAAGLFLEAKQTASAARKIAGSQQNAANVRHHQETPERNEHMHSHACRRAGTLIPLKSSMCPGDPGFRSC